MSRSHDTQHILKGRYSWKLGIFFLIHIYMYKCHGRYRLFETIEIVLTYMWMCVNIHRESSMYIGMNMYIYIQKWFYKYTCVEHIKLPAKLLDYFLRSHQSNINQCVCVCVLKRCYSWKCGGAARCARNLWNESRRINQSCHRIFYATHVTYEWKCRRAAECSRSLGMCHVTHFFILQHTATHCNTLHHRDAQHARSLWKESCHTCISSATRCNTLQHRATRRARSLWNELCHINTWVMPHTRMSQGIYGWVTSRMNITRYICLLAMWRHRSCEFARESKRCTPPSVLRERSQGL